MLLGENRVPQYLTLHQHVEELVAGLLSVPLHAQVPQVVVGDPQARQVAHVGALVVQPPALRAGDEIKELLRLRGRHQGGLRCGRGEEQRGHGSAPSEPEFSPPKSRSPRGALQG